MKLFKTLIPGLVGYEKTTFLKSISPAIEAGFFDSTGFSFVFFVSAGEGGSGIFGIRSTK